ncbi:MAG: globin [Pseudomonadaceae bacterium]|nr:globin [Pseudomonadaceae bacterium]
MTDLVEQSFELAAQRAGDITDSVYDAYFAACPAAQELLGHADAHMRGRMLEDVLGLIMTPTDEVDPSYVAWEVENHVAGYSVHADMYKPLFTALRDVVANSLAGDFDNATAVAWQQRLDSLTNRFESAAEQHTPPL